MDRQTMWLVKAGVLRIALELTISATQWVGAFEELYSCKSVGSTPPIRQSTPYPTSNVCNSLRPKDSSNTSTSPNVDQSPLDADISEDEVIAALGKLRLKKAPGIDGISTELLKLPSMF
jgi:hypothetical protein